MTELRLDPLRRRWVVTGKRPQIPGALDPGAECPFCPGQEGSTPKAIRERQGANGAWTARVFHDRAPLFRIEEEERREGEGVFDRMGAVGAHEIVVETPRHGVTFGELTEEEAISAVSIWRERILDLKKDRRFRYISVYKHQVSDGPGSHGHVHSQILATPIIPPLLERELRWSLAQYQRKERCLCCDIIEQERRSAKRLVDETADFVALCPYASQKPYEIWILPFAHASAFELDLTDREREAHLATFLKACIQRVENLSRSLSMTIHTEPNLNAPIRAADEWKTIREDFHWHIEIAPRLDAEPPPLGAEGFYFNPIPAEEAATVLRALKPSISA